MTEEKALWETIYDTYNEYKNTFAFIGVVGGFVGLGYNIHKLNVKNQQLEKQFVDCIEHFKDVAVTQEMIIKYIKNQGRRRYPRVG